MTNANGSTKLCSHTHIVSHFYPFRVCVRVSFIGKTPEIMWKMSEEKRSAKEKMEKKKNETQQQKNNSNSDGNNNNSTVKHTDSTGRSWLKSKWTIPSWLTLSLLFSLFSAPPRSVCCSRWQWHTNTLIASPFRLFVCVMFNFQTVHSCN